MSRRVVILQRGNDRMAALAAVLGGRGHPVVVARSEKEAIALVQESCGTLVVDGPRLEAEDSLCRYVRAEIRPVPTIIGVLTPDQPPPLNVPYDVILLQPQADENEIAGAVEGATMWWPGEI